MADCPGTVPGVAHHSGGKVLQAPHADGRKGDSRRLLLPLRIAQTRQILSISCFESFEAVAMLEVRCQEFEEKHAQFVTKRRDTVFEDCSRLR